MIILKKRWLAVIAVCVALLVAVPHAVAYFPASRSVAGSTVSNWGLGFHKNGEPPTANADAASLKQYNAYYVGDGTKKVIYLTFDAGYENGYTAPILDALKKHRVPATFFLVKNYLDTAPELVKRMVAEGHTVANHTASHPDMSRIADEAAFAAELHTLEEAYQSITGTEMVKYYRPPQGKYSEQNLRTAANLGYHTFFWSLAYVDWYVDRQPTREEALNKLTTRIHPGAVVLLHSTSATNAQILDELLTKWEGMGYTFAPLSDLIT